MRFNLSSNAILLATCAALLLVSSASAVPQNTAASSTHSSAANGTASAGGSASGPAAELQACLQQCAAKSATDVDCQGLGEPSCFCSKQEFVDETAKCSMTCANANAQALSAGIEQLKQLCIAATGNFTLTLTAGLAGGAATNATTTNTAGGSSTTTTPQGAGNSDAAAFIGAPAVTALAGAFIFTVAVASTL